MVFKVKNQDGRVLGRIGFTDNKPVFLDSDYNSDFTSFIRESLRQGIRIIEDKYDFSTNSFRMVKGDIVPEGDPLFPLVFRDFLKQSGYEIIEEHPEVEEKIKAFLKDTPDDDPDKTDVLKRLPEMSYLEQTLLLAELEQGGVVS